jgi:hypothetical protein
MSSTPDGTVGFANCEFCISKIGIRQERTKKAHPKNNNSLSFLCKLVVFLKIAPDLGQKGLYPFQA